MTDRELMQMALDALNNFDKGNHGMRWQVPIIKALRSRLANEFNPDWNQVEALQESLREHMAEIQRLRARLAQHEPWVKTYSGGKPNYTEPCERCGEVNPAEIHTCTPKQPEPEPVAWRGSNWSLSPDNYVYRDYDDPLLNIKGENVGEPLYTAPPQREWQGLTNDEIDDIWAKFNDGYSIIEETLWGYERAIEAKIREKNA